MKKKAVSLFLALTLCIAMAVPAFAEGETSITFNGAEYTLSNPVISTEEWTHEVNGEVVTDIIYSVPVGTVATTPDGLEWKGSFVYGFADSDILELLGMGDLEGNTFTVEEYLVGLMASDGQYDQYIYFRGVEISGKDSDPASDDLTPPQESTPSSWAAEFVASAINAGLVPENLQGEYQAATTRAEFCALAVALYETVTGTELTDRTQFDDTDDINVEKMAALGVVNGVGDNKFAPDTGLTREQAATMLYRLAAAVGNPLRAEKVEDFDDIAIVSDWAIDAVGQMKATEVMNGVGGNTFAPKADYTREQSIMTILRLYDIVK